MEGNRYGMMMLWDGDITETLSPSDLKDKERECSGNREQLRLHENVPQGKWRLWRRNIATGK